MSSILYILPLMHMFDLLIEYIDAYDAGSSRLSNKYVWRMLSTLLSGKKYDSHIIITRLIRRTRRFPTGFT